MYRTYARLLSVSLLSQVPKAAIASCLDGKSRMDVSPHILVVDADAEVRRSLAEYLGEFEFRVSGAPSSGAMESALDHQAIDLVLLSLPATESGIDLIQEVRGRWGIPIIVLSRRHAEADGIIGLELGADDYLTSPYNLREVVARIRTVLRRSHLPSGDEEPLRALRFAQWELNLQTGHLLSNDDQVVVLTPSELALLRVFLDAPEQSLSREQLLDSIKRRGFNTLLQRIDVLVLRLRRKIESDPTHPRLIRTERGLGYFFHARVHRVT